MENEKVNNADEYVSRMNKSMLDKLFFLDKVQASWFLDYGCAEGDLLGAMSSILDDPILVGYDKSEDMVRKAEEKYPDINFYSNWPLSKATQTPHALLLSSIIHEVYHYSDASQIDNFWKRVYESGFQYIVIRDMLPSNTIDRASDVNDVVKVYREFYKSKALMDFESIWGRIDNNKNLVHFLLKYPYIEPNWDREVKENYFPISKEDLLATIPASYSVLYQEHYTLPYLKEKIQHDVGIDVKDHTHLKLILKRNEKS